MSNKDVFKELYSKKLNKEKNYNKIVETIERENRSMNKYVKWAFVPMCLVAVICGVMVFGGNNHSLKSPNKEVDKPYVDKNNNVILNINHVDKEIGMTKIDASVKEVSNYYNIPYYKVLSNLELPKDFENKEYINAVYTKSNRETAEYDYLMQYEKMYKNSNNDRNIVISYSEKNKPIRDYHFENGKTSVINDVELTIYQYKNSYMTEFNYKNLNIDIETSNVSQQELVALLQSIIK